MAPSRMIIVTGASSGIGAYCARALKRDGWRVFATARKAGDLRQLEEDGIEAFYLVYREAESIEALVEAVLERTGGTLDALYNNGAHAQAGAVEDLPMQARWRFVHLIEWEAVNGPVPDGHCLKCLDGDRTNTTPANWTLIPRGVLPRLNGGRATRHIPYDTAAAELKPTLLALARVEHQARRLRRGQPSEAGQITPKETTR